MNQPATISKAVVLCADDFGLNPSVCEGILTLIAHQRITATSCITHSACWPTYAKRLAALHPLVDIGLHFTLTSYDTNSYRVVDLSLIKLLSQSVLGQLKVDNIAAELRKQLDLFTEYFGAPPDFIDGHHHVLQIPQVQEALLLVYPQYFKKPHRPYIRLLPRMINRELPSLDKQLLLYGINSNDLSRKFSELRIPLISDFAGLYPASQAKHCRNYFKLFLQQIKSGGVIMCHPGQPPNEKNDPIAKLRNNEFDYLNSSEFLQDLDKNQVQLKRHSPHHHQFMQFEETT